MRTRWIRLLSVFVCLTILAGAFGGISSAAFSEESAEKEQPETAPVPTEEPEFTQASEEPEQTTEATVIPALPQETTEPSIEPTAEPSAEPSLEPSSEPSLEPSAESSPEAQATPEASEVVPAAVPGTPSPGELLAEKVRAVVLACEEAGNRTDFDRALWLHDYLIDNASLASPKDDNGGAEAVLLNGSGTSAAFALAYGALLSATQIDNVCVYDLDDADAAWNAVRLDGDWYHVSVALDKTSGTSRYVYFCVTDTVMARAHRWNPTDVRSSCAATADNYFVREKGYATFETQAELDALLSAAAERGAGKLLLYCAGADATAEAMAEDWFARNLTWSGSASAESDWLICVSIAPAGPAAPEVGAQAQNEPVALEGIVPAATNLTIGVGERVSVAGWTAEPAGASAAVTYASSKSSVAKVSGSGVVKGRKVGAAVIVIRDASGVEAEVQVRVKKAPAKITAKVERTKLGVGEEMRIATALSKGSAGAVTFVSSNEAVATVDADGVIRAMGQGSAKITAATYNGKKASVKITVVKAPEAMELLPSELTVAAGDTQRLAAILNEGSAGAVTYAADDPAVLAVDVGGEIAGIAEGETTVRAVAYNGVEAMCQVEVVAAPQSATILAARTVLGVGEKLALETRVEPSNVDASIRYSSSKTSVATVSAAGVVTAKRVGETTVTVKTYNGVKATIRIKVQKAPGKITAKVERTKLGVGEETRIVTKLSKGSAGAVTFVSSDETVATVDADGMIRAVGSGSAKITAATYNKKKAKIVISVVAAPESVTVSPLETVLGVGQTQALGCALSQGSAGAVSYASSDEAVASVDAKTGKLIAVGEGQATITATAYNGVSGAMVATVMRAPEWVKLEPATLTIGVGESCALAPLIPDGSAAAFTYATSAKKYVKVSGSGVVNGIREGKAKITVRTYNGETAAVIVVVRRAPAAIAIETARLTLGVGESRTLRYAISKGSASAVQAVSDNPGVVSVGAENELTAVGCGVAAVTYSTFNGKTAVCTVTVAPAPTAISLYPQGGVLGVGQTLRLFAGIDLGSASRLRFKSADGAVLSVTEDGLVTAVGVGAATVSVYTHIENVWAAAEFTVLPAPTGISLAEGQDPLLLNVGDTWQLQPQLPTGTAAGLSFASGNEAVFTVSPEGLITAVGGGEAAATVTAHNGVSASVIVRVIDPLYPDECVLVDSPGYLDVGETFTPKTVVTPSTAEPQLSWSTSDARIARVNELTGVVTAVSRGAATIRASSGKNPAIAIKFTLIVLSDDRCLAMPERRTGIDGIGANLKRIDRVRESAFQELEDLRVRGTISGAEFLKRKSIVGNAFTMYSFPWMTLTTQPYWRAANSEGGAKDFQPGIVYYGLPYINSPVANRRYNVSKAVSERRYTDSGAGFYLLNRNRPLNGLYCGNDCSSFVSMAIWGTGSAHSDDKTWDIAVSSAYKTVSAADLRPGDLINKSNKHVVMFLYYADAAHTQMVIIEQGGAEAAINTCSTSIRSVAYYLNAGYVPRRLKSY